MLAGLNYLDGLNINNEATLVWSTHDSSINQSNVKIIVPHNSNAIAGALHKNNYKTKTIITQKEVCAGYD